MAFTQRTASVRPTVPGLLGALRAGPSATDQPVYRCIGCGDEITYDALSATCRCTEECYGAAPADPQALAH
jgi:hypothetical protein